MTTVAKIKCPHCHQFYAWYEVDQHGAEICIGRTHYSFNDEPPPCGVLTGAHNTADYSRIKVTSKSREVTCKHCLSYLGMIENREEV